MLSIRSWASCLTVVTRAQVTDSDTALVTVSWRQRRAGPVFSIQATITVREESIERGSDQRCLDSEQLEKYRLERKRERNRIAATKCRSLLNFRYNQLIV